jgi:DNA-binding MarR family transcriptional regulator
MATAEPTADDFVALAHRLLRLRSPSIFPEDRLGHMRRHLHRLRLHRFKERGGDPGDRMFLFRILDILAHSETPPTMGELSAKLGIPLSTATRMADGLVRASFVKRSVDRDDRRVVRLSITESGRQFIEFGMDSLKERVRQLLTHFSAEEQGQLLKLMTKLMDSIEAQRTKEPPHATL